MEIVGVTSRYSPAMIFNKLRIDVDDIPSRERIPPWGRKVIFKHALGWDMLVPKRTFRR